MASDQTADQPPRWLFQGRIPCLDGLRALAVILVVVSHAQRTPGFPQGLPSLIHLGSLGVSIFFVLSGFLITTLMLREIDRTGQLGIKQFYLRRCLRIVPAYTGYLAALVILQRLGEVQLTAWEWFSISTYTYNLYPTSKWVIAHIWSLCVEEHFYLIWPLLMTFGLAWGQRTALACLAFCFGMRVLLQLPGATDDIYFCSFTRMDTIATGCLLAILARSPQWRGRLDRLSGHWWLIAGLLLVHYGIELLSYRMSVAVTYSATAFAIALLVWAVVRREHAWLGRCLSWRPLEIIGIGSYSIYLWQQLFFSKTGAMAFGFPGNILAILAVAWLSYRYIESPFLSLKDRLTAIPAPAVVIRRNAHGCLARPSTGDWPLTTDSTDGTDKEATTNPICAIRAIRG